MQKRMALVMVLVIAASMLSLAQEKKATGKIRGTVVDEHDVPVKRISLGVLPMATAPPGFGASIGGSGGWGPTAGTNDRGEFVIDVDVRRDSHGIVWGAKSLIWPWDEKNLYPDVSPNFYRTDTMQTAQVEVSVTPEQPNATGIILRAVQAGVLKGVVKDAISGTPLNDAYFDIAWAHDPATDPAHAHRMGGKMGSNFRILLPPNTDITLKVLCPGHEAWVYPGTINVGSGQEVKLDVLMQPSKTADK